MKPGKAIFILELKRLVNRKNLSLLTFLLLLSLYMVQIGIDGYKNTVENKEAFRNFEELKVKQYVTYGQYGTYGFRILFIPSSTSIFFHNSSTISQLTSNVDSGERLNIYNSFKGPALFTEKSGGFKDFSGIMLLLGSLLMLYLGYESFIHKDYLRFMLGFIGYKKLFFSIILARLGICLSFFAVTAGLAFLLLKINNIQLDPNEMFHLAIFLTVLLVLMIFFLALGTIGGSFKSQFTGFVMILVSWFALVFLAPGIVSSITSRKAENIVSNYKLELDKLRVMMDVEKRLDKKVKDIPLGQDKNLLLHRLVNEYWNTEFLEIINFEKNLENQMTKNIRLFQQLSFFFPSTFYLSTNDEISSKGFENFIRFFGHIQSLKTNFVKFYLDKRYPLPPSTAPVPPPTQGIQSFIKGNENLFYAQSGLPQGFFNGLLISLLYILGTFLLSFYRFKNSLKQ